MGVRTALKKELMGLQDSALLAADDVRAKLTHAVKAQPETSEQGFALMSRFNDNHGRLQNEEAAIETDLRHQTHRLFNEIVYTEESVNSWLKKNLNRLN